MSRKLAKKNRALTIIPALAAGLLALGSPTPSFGQAAPRIMTAVEGSPLVTLPGNTHPLAQARFDRGPAPASLNGRMLLMLKRSPDQEAQLDQLIADQQNPASPNYHKWLTPAQFGERFGVADADLQTVTGYLAAQGFGVGRVFAGKGAIEVSGTAAQIRSTFHTEIHQYAVNGQSFYANNKDPQIPAALAPVVAGFASLNNFRVAPASTTQPATFDLATHRARPLYNVPNTTTFAVTPGDLATIYNIPASGSFGNGGQGVTIGVVGDSNINLAYINNYRSTFGLPANAPSVIVDGNDPGVNNDAYIAYKQLELAGAVAPNATINYYTSATTDYDTGLNFAIIRAVGDNAVQVLTIGFQSCETAIGNGLPAFINQAWRQAAAQGITVVAAAGNTGSAGCDVPGFAGAASNGLAVNGYASSPYVTAVGGTDFFYVNANAYATYWTSGSTQYSSAKSYIPEQAWNDSNISNDAVAGTQVLLAGGGGLSNAGTNGVSIPTPQPSYQIGVVPASVSSTVRALPDVSFFAGSGANNTMGYNNTAYLFCMANADCQSGTPQFTISGGTEASSAVFAGAMALVVGYQNTLRGSSYPANQNTGVGNANPVLYTFVSKAVGVFHDITRGNNEVQCTTKNCTGGFMTGYATRTGYDAATGLGSFDITSLVSNWNKAVLNTTGTTTTLAVTNFNTGLPVTTIQHSTPVLFAVQVTGNGTVTPTGDAAVYTNSPLASEASAGLLPLSAGTTPTGAKIGQATSTPNSVLPGGTYQISARYVGDQTFAGSVSAPTTITVTPEPSVMVVYAHNVNASGSTIPYGSPVQITVEPYSAASNNNVGIPSGSIQVLDGGSVITSLPINSEGAATFSSNLLNFGNHSIVLKYLGDASFTGSQTSAFNFAVTSATTQTVLNPSTRNLGVGGNNADGLTAVVNSATLPSNGTSPTGTVTFSTATPKTAPLIAGFDPNGNAISTASVTISPDDVPASGVISATYTPTGSNYSGSTSPQVSFTATQSQFAGTSNVTFTLTDTNGPCQATCQQVPGLAFPTSDSLVMGINVATDSPDASYVTVYANGTPISGQLIPDQNGNVSFAIPRQNGYLQLPSGQVQFTVQYDGWEQYLFGFDPIFQSPPASTNLSVTITDNRTSADFSLQSDITTNQQNPLTAAASSASYQLLLTSIYNFQSAYGSTPVNLSCSIPNNPGLQCTLSSNPVTLGGSGFATSTLTVSPASGRSIASNTIHEAPSPRWWVAGSTATLACVFLFGLPNRRRRWQSMLGSIALVLLLTGLSGCGSAGLNSLGLASSSDGRSSANGGSPSANTGPVQPGVYPVVVTATTTTNTLIVHSLAVTVVVTNQ